MSNVPFLKTLKESVELPIGLKMLILIDEAFILLSCLEVLPLSLSAT